MHLSIVARILGALLLLFSTTLLAPLGISLAIADGIAPLYALTLGGALLAGLVLWLPSARTRHVPLNRHGFLIVALFWVAMGAFGAVPFVLATELDFAQALFEAVSGFTTTGATVITDLDALPRSLLFFRQQLQWFGGIGVIVSAVAILPMLKVGGMQLYKAEVPGPVKDEKLTPRIAQSARTLCSIYVALTAACALLYWLAGMDPFDAIGHSFSTLSTGGFSTHDESMAWFDDAAIELIAVAFMILGGISFGLHFRVWKQLDLSAYLRNDETRWFLLILAAASAFCALVLLAADPSIDGAVAARRAVFTVTSVMTTSGFGVDDFSIWPLALPPLVLFLSFTGACASSTTGGMKLVRFVVLARQAGIHVRRLIHPNLVQMVKLDGQVVPASVIDGVWGFFAVYMFTFAVLMVALMMLGMDHISAFGAVAACLNNLGPGLGSVALGFAGQSDAVLHLMSFAMLLGRLEIFTFLVLMSPEFWRG